MPLTRYAMYSLSIERCAAPSDDCGLGTLRHIAREACGWVINSGRAFRAGAMADDLPGKVMMYPHPGAKPG